MSLPRSCHVCGDVHAAGTRCGIAVANHDKRRGTSTERYGKGWAAISRRVIARDRGICHWCGGKATTADHLIARSLGGTNDLSNLVAACKPCNSSRGVQAA